MPAVRKNTTPPPRAPVANPAEDILDGLRDLIDMKRAGIDPANRYPARTYCVPDPSAWTAGRVHDLRCRLGLAPPIFARLLGVSTGVAQGWESGRRTPSPIAARLLDTIDHDPAAWLASIGAELPAVEAPPVRHDRRGAATVGASAR